MAEDKQTESSPRGYHDIGGDRAGNIPKVELHGCIGRNRLRQCATLGDGTRRIISLDEMRRGFENFGAEKYRTLSFYRRRLEAMIDILIEKEVISEVALKSAIERKRKIWERTPKEVGDP